MKKISLIVPVYNAAPYLPDFWAAIRAQDWDNLQILFSEDGSTDDSPALLRQFAAEDPRVTLITGENLGVSTARNRALALADGDYIGFGDADDLPEPDWLRTLADALEESGSDMACCGFSRHYTASGVTDGLPTTGHVRQVTDRTGMAELLLRPDGYTTVLWNKLFRREALTEPDGTPLRFDESIHIVEDGEFIFRSTVRSAVFLPQRLYRYYVRGTGALYGQISDRRLTEPDARKKIAEMAESISPEVRDLARMKYQKGIRDLMFHGVISGNGNAVRPLTPELRTWRRELFSSPALSKKEKLKYHIYYPIIRWNLKKTGALLMAKFSGH